MTRAPAATRLRPVGVRYAAGGFAGLLAGVAIVLVRADESTAGASLVIAGVTVLGAIAVYDIASHRARDVVVLPGLMLVLIGSAFLGRDAIVQAASGAGAMFAIFAVVALAGRGAMGAGDVKVAALCGALVGLDGVLATTLATFVAGGLFAMLALLTRRRGRRDTVAFTPFLVLGVLFALVRLELYPLR